jgi:SAM-dependent methyltransferase
VTAIRTPRDSRAGAYQRTRMAYWDDLARRDDHPGAWGAYYRRRLARVYRSFVSPGQRVLEVGCAQGDLLASLGVSQAVGVDFSSEMLGRARRRHPQVRFVSADAHDLRGLEGDGPFDLIILSDVVNDIWDVQTVFEQLAGLCSPQTRVILNFYSRLWEPALALVASLGLATPTLHQNWFSVDDVANLLRLAGFEAIRHWEELLWPIGTPVVSGAANRYLVRLSPFRWFALTNFVLARPAATPVAGPEPMVSVIVPARNEAGNIPPLLERIPEMGAGTEIVFVEGHSTDDTFATIQREIEARPDRRCQLLRQAGIGKGDAVRLGFDNARGDILMILDADLSVSPEDLPRFYDAIRSGTADFVNGVRLVYPLEGRAMRFWNLIGNKCFSLAFSWLCSQPIKDTLCGTKVLHRREYARISANRHHFGDFDPFGDFDLLFGAARLALKIVDLPIRYHARTYGTTNIQRWRHGWLLLRMVVFAARRLKFT